jgi:hypothetical protein
MSVIPQRKELHKFSPLSNPLVDAIAGFAFYINNFIDKKILEINNNNLRKKKRTRQHSSSQNNHFCLCLGLVVVVFKYDIELLVGINELLF